MKNNIPNRYVDQITNIKEGNPKISDYGEFIKQIYRLSACKYMPNGLKPFIWMDGSEFLSLSTAFSDDNGEFRDGLRKEGIEKKNNAKEFKIIHLWGAHYPYYINENTEDIEATYANAQGTANACISLVEEYINGMKENGTYDCSAIIITSDHGFNSD